MSSVACFFDSRCIVIGPKHTGICSRTLINYLDSGSSREHSATTDEIHPSPANADYRENIQ